ncbi:MAG: hypothetical protein ACR2PH_10275, partial [Desulfobulbia bacterium]
HSNSSFPGVVFLTLFSTIAPALFYLRSSMVSYLLHLGRYSRRGSNFPHPCGSPVVVTPLIHLVGSSYRVAKKRKKCVLFSF